MRDVQPLPVWYFHLSINIIGPDEVTVNPELYKKIGEVRTEKLDVTPTVQGDFLIFVCIFSTSPLTTTISFDFG